MSAWLEAQSGAAWRETAAAGGCVIRLPYPPTMNHAYAPGLVRRKGRNGGPSRIGATILKTEDAKAYAAEAWWLVRQQRAALGFDCPLAVLVCAAPPDALRRDLGNLEKVLTDALVAAGVMADDSCIHDFRVVWAASAHGAAHREPGVEISLRPLRPDELSGAKPQPKRPARSRLVAK